MSENYPTQDAPKLNVAFFDIETDFDPERGFADPSDPTKSLLLLLYTYNGWMLLLHLLLPKTLTMEQAKEECKEWGQDVILYENEGDMLQAFQI